MMMETNDENLQNDKSFDTIEINPPQFEEDDSAKSYIHENSISKKNYSDCNQSISITVEEPQKVGDGIGVCTTVYNVPGFKKTESITLRRFSDFLGLYDILVGKYLRTGHIIPAPPQKNIIGTTKVKMTNQQNEIKPSINNDWLESRRASLERYLNRTAQFKILRTDPDFINFLESDEELPRAVSTSTLSGAGVLRLFNKVGETVNKITYRMDENDQWFNDKINEIEVIDIHLQKMYVATKNLSLNRKELASYTGHVAKAAAVLSACEEHTELSRALSQLANIEEKIELLRSEQANSDFYILSEQIKDYIGLISAVKDVFHERVKTFQNWEYAQLQLTKKRENLAKLEGSGRNEKLDWAEKEVDEWNSKVVKLEKEFTNISNQIKIEIEEFDMQRVYDFKSLTIKYIEDQMAHQNQLMKYWQAYLSTANELV
uniref:CSON006366 protein n=1 Tax=Culicoides sonorensis TaxID=179676 RepID=A0A336LIT4_CULSO